MHGVKPLISYLASQNRSYSEAEIHELIAKKVLPHSNPMSNVLVFDLDHIDWWIDQMQPEK
ncbi:hypothetical protein [Planococcus lenghuensis]|uniref:hypothetical protein n=1 Tax=Planococcus lenghuensis TaxID=2213202 RepID=UPI0038CD5BDF